MGQHVYRKLPSVPIRNELVLARKIFFILLADVRVAGALSGDVWRLIWGGRKLVSLRATDSTDKRVTG
jgi:hypothetical protein